jgi:alpha-ketoglutarate-dependent taurine dioxygenase
MPDVQMVFGAQLTADGAPSAKAVRHAACERGFTLMRGCRFDEDSFRRFVNDLGSTVRYEKDNASVGYGFADVLYLDGSSDHGKVVTGQGGLPLHTDGVLLGTQVDLIILFAQRASGTANGSTLVCDQLQAWADMPAELQKLVDGRPLEYQVEERGYFTSVPNGWYPISTQRDYGRIRSLNLALPFKADEPASWSVRVPGVSAEESEQLLQELSDHLNQPQYLYQHRWQVGDLLVIDNQRTLHGRRGLGGSERLLLRGQATLSCPNQTSRAG